MNWSPRWTLVGAIVAGALIVAGLLQRDVSSLPFVLPMLPAGPFYWISLGAYCGSRDPRLKHSGQKMLVLQMVVAAIAFISWDKDGQRPLLEPFVFLETMWPYLLALTLFGTLARRGTMEMKSRGLGG